MNNTLKIVIALLLCICVGYFIYSKQTKSTSPQLNNSGTTSINTYKFAEGSLPNNPNIKTSEQKFLFENLLKRDSTLEERKKILTMAVNAAVDTNALVLSDNCLSNPPVIKMTYASKLSVSNTSKTDQQMIIGTSSVILPKNSVKTVTLEQLGVGQLASKGVVLKSYACTGLDYPAGFIVVYPN